MLNETLILKSKSLSCHFVTGALMQVTHNLIKISLFQALAKSDGYDTLCLTEIILDSFWLQDIAFCILINL